MPRNGLPPRLKRHIFLIGMPGSGKTTLGHALSRCGYDFVDLDEYIEAGQGMTVAALVAAAGMPAFRRMETDALRQLVAGSPCIIACGGGTPCQDGNIELMRRAGTCVLLHCDRDRHIQRIAEAGARRPMFADICHDSRGIDTLLQQLEAERAPYYNRADLSFDTTRLETEAEIAATTDLFISIILSN